MQNNGGFFKYFKGLAAKANATTNSKEAIAIRNKLIKIGIVLLAIGGIGVFGCFIGFVMGGVSAVNNFDMGFGPQILVPFFLIIPFGICSSAGGVALYCGLGITAAKVVSKFVDENKYCPYCHDIIDDDELYCSHCGKPLLANKICKSCGKENDIDSVFCKGCGSKLD